MKKQSISEIANLLKVAQMTVYRKVKKLKKELANHTVKEKGVLFFTPEGVEIIRASISTAPIETTLEAIQPGPTTLDLAPVISRFGDMEKGILAITEAFKGETKHLREDMARLGEVMTRMNEENRALKKEVLNLQKMLPAPQKPAPKQPTFGEVFNHELREFQSWLSGVIAPFIEPFRSNC